MMKRRVFKIDGFLNQLLFVIIGDSYVENYGRAARKPIFFSARVEGRICCN